jgi:glycosyltransferase involved in cell wall biosynthesis
MKILLLVDDYMPDSIKVAAVMMHDLAVELKNQGHDVTVCTPDEALSGKFLIGEYDDIRTLRFKLGAIKNVSKIKRAINETLLSYNAWKNLKPYFENNPQDLIVYYSPTIFFGGLVNRLKLTWKCKSFLILRDFFPQWTVDNGLITEGSLIHRYFKYFENISYGAADVIAVQSPSNKLYFQGKGQYDRYKSKLDVLYNWSDTTKGNESDGSIRDKLGLNEKVVFFYGGNIGHAQDMMNIIRLAQSLSQYPQAHFVLVGKGDEVELILDYIVKNNLKNITYLNSVSQEEYNKILMEFDVGLFSLHKGHRTHNFPGKLLGYMKSSKPILGSVNKGNDVIDVISNANAGLISINGDDEVFTKNAIKLLKSHEIRKEKGGSAYILLNDVFSVKSAASKILGMCHN